MTILIILLVLWDLYWKAHALWMAAQNNDKKFFIALLVINSVGIIDICSKSELINPIKNPNKAKVNATKISKKIIKNGYLTWTSTKNNEVKNIIILTINVFVAPAPTKARTTSNVEIGAAKIS